MLDAAVLDVNLADGSVTPILEALSAPAFGSKDHHLVGKSLTIMIFHDDKCQTGRAT
jgi:hypothetical protein